MSEMLLQSARFAAVGVINTIIGLGCIYAFLFFFGVGPIVANATGFSVGLAISFILNRLWTFSSNIPVAELIPKYLLVTIIAYTLNLGMVVLASVFFSANPYLAQIPGICIYTVFMFLGCRLFVFKVK